MNESKLRIRCRIEPLRRFAVLGGGVSGRAAARLLLHLGKAVQIVDDKDLAQNAEVTELLAHGAQARSGKLNGTEAAAALAADEALILSPGIPSEHPVLLAAREAKLEIIPELELAWGFSGKARAAAITGTNGKTTATMLVQHILAASGARSVAAGNIGLALSDAVLQAGAALDETFFSIEASSFQLEETREFAPEAAVLLNVTPDHLDRHRSMESYSRAKARVTAAQGPDQFFIANQDDAECLRIAREGPARAVLFSLIRPVEQGAWLEEERLMISMNGAKPARLMGLEEIPLFGMHNVSNVLACAAAAAALGVDRKIIREAIMSFEGAPHRLELVAKIGGVSYINDSKATNVDAMIKAAESFEAPIHLIAGGRDKDSPFEIALPALAPRVRRAYLIGEAAEKIARAWSGTLEIAQCETLALALERASDTAGADEIILLAPGCASFDQFDSYAHRGKTFREWVRAREAAAGETRSAAALQSRPA